MIGENQGDTLYSASTSLSFFSMAAVGAFNVGSIRVKAEPDFHTNTVATAFSALNNLRYFSWHAPSARPKRQPGAASD